MADTTENHASRLPGQVALGLRVELFDESGKILGAILREDLTAAAVPRAGEFIAIAGMGQEMYEVVGAPMIHHVDHYLKVPGVRDSREPLCMAVSQLEKFDLSRLDRYRAEIERQGWLITLF